MLLQHAHGPSKVDRQLYVITHVVGITALLAGLACIVRASGLDLALANFVFDASRGDFAWRRSALLELLGHQVALALPIGVAVAAFVGLVASYCTRGRGGHQRAACGCLLLAMVAVPLLIGLLKDVIDSPRPWSLSIFGGSMALPAFPWLQDDELDEGALPSHHAGAGYAITVVYFFGWAVGSQRCRWWGLLIGASAGLAFGAVRVLQGAHFLSQTLWSAAVVWLIASLCFMPLLTRPARPSPPSH